MKGKAYHTKKASSAMELKGVGERGWSRKLPVSHGFTRRNNVYSYKGGNPVAACQLSALTKVSAVELGNRGARSMEKKGAKGTGGAYLVESREKSQK